MELYMAEKLRFMFIGDIMGQTGQSVFQKWNNKLREKYKVDSVIVNGENSMKNGKGIDPKAMEFFKNNGVDIVTSGNHIWKEKKIYNYLAENSDLLRPANFPPGCPGEGYSIFEVKGQIIAVVCLQGRSFMHEHLDCPFRTMDTLLTFLQLKTNIILIDFHTETTAEKQALAFYLDGKISGLFGTHTHVQTSDERILPNGTAFITDLGFCGSLDSVIGMEKGAVINRFITQMPDRFVVSTKPPFILNGIVVEIEAQSGKALKIERINIIDHDLIIT
jgi:2',3'-cyclic-nucleotide 2'-phosphodiesterase